MPWNEDRIRWDCEVCDQTVSVPGPWCDLYRAERALCRPLAKLLLRQADAQGDGPLVNALCEAGRRRWGIDMDW